MPLVGARGKLTASWSSTLSFQTVMKKTATGITEISVALEWAGTFLLRLRFLGSEEKSWRQEVWKTRDVEQMMGLGGCPEVQALVAASESAETPYLTLRHPPEAGNRQLQLGQRWLWEPVPSSQEQGQPRASMGQQLS